MKAMHWNVLMYGMPVVLALGLVADVAYVYGLDAGKAQAKAQFSINKAAEEAQATHQPTQKELDAQCSAWLFDTNVKAAKKRICGK